jgi:hypothetical protein
MSKLIHRIVLFFIFVIAVLPGWSQDSLNTEKPEMASLMRSNGKIYVVVTVLLIILAGLFLYLINTDRKLSRLEKTAEIEHKQKLPGASAI